MTEVSVVIPVFNRDWQLHRAIKSVLLQSFQDFEIIVIDDASTLNIPKVIAGFQDNRIKYLRNDTNLHASASRNIGIRKAKGEYVAFLDSDDEWKTTHLQVRLKYIKNNGVTGVYGPSLIYQAGKLTSSPEARILNKGEFMLEYFLSGRLRASTPSLMFATNILKNYEFNENLKQQEDYNLVCQIAKDYHLGCVNQSTVIVHDDVSDTKRLSHQWHHRSCIDSIKYFSPEIDFDILFNYVYTRLKSLSNEELYFSDEYIILLKKNKYRKGFKIKLLNLNLALGFFIIDSQIKLNTLLKS